MILIVSGFLVFGNPSTKIYCVVTHFCPFTCLICLANQAGERAAGFAVQKGLAISHHG
jgi:hypothetical protein